MKYYYDFEYREANNETEAKEVLNDLMINDNFQALGDFDIDYSDEQYTNKQEAIKEAKKFIKENKKIVDIRLSKWDECELIDCWYYNFKTKRFE